MNPPTMKSLVAAVALVAFSGFAGSAALAQTTLKPDATAPGGVPEAVKVYVTHMAGSPYPYSGFELKVGHRVDAGEVFRKVPQYTQFSFANLGGQVVVIDTSTQKILAIY